MKARSGMRAFLPALLFDTAPNPDDQRTEVEMREFCGTRAFAEPILAEAGLPLGLAEALDDEPWDLEIQQKTDEALSLTGKDVGTPIIHFEPPAGLAFFGPVISRLPREDSAAELWDHVVGLARFAGFAELERSLREPPQLAAFGVDTDTDGKQEN